MIEREAKEQLPYFELDYSKLTDENGMGVIPAVILESSTNRPLMVGFMNKEAFQKSREIKKAVFWKRTEARLWTKGETSGNFLEIVNWVTDCDSDTLVVYTNPAGNTCHKGTQTCFD